MDLSARITGISYAPHLCSALESFAFADLERAFSKSSFVLDIDRLNRVAVSRWVSPKRTRSYPHARVYDTLGFSGKKITVIPVIKDEGKVGRSGDRDFLQWDTISLMSLLGVYVIITNYVDADRSRTYPGKITNQRFNVRYVKNQINEILSYQSSSLHWNLEQSNNVGEIAQQAMDSYSEISKRLNVEMHSQRSAERRIQNLRDGRETFMSISRELAESAQRRESVTIQPKEQVSGTKGSITIQNFQGGYYYLTLDEVEVVGQDIFLIEAKHSSKSMLPSENDIKDALIKMLLFTNLKDVQYDGRTYNPVPVMKLTGAVPFILDALSPKRQRFWETLNQNEAQNGFIIRMG